MVGIIPFRVVGIVPVVEIVPVRVVEMVPVLVVEIVPPFEKATLDRAKINKAEQKVHFKVLMILSWCCKRQGRGRFVRVAYLADLRADHLTTDFTMAVFKERAKVAEIPPTLVSLCVYRS